MFSSDQYELLDFGDGRKLERFGNITLDRPSPAAEGAMRHSPGSWSQAAARYDRAAARWRGDLPDAWTIQHAASTFQLRPTEFGHVGLFAEQAINWPWIAAQASAAGRPLKVLNLFAYTGGSTLAAAAAGAEVTHIDAAHNVVQWARRNAELSGLADRPIRWIAEDATKFVDREVRRGNQYDAVILDPPSYGHGPKGEPWKIEDDLSPLLHKLAQLTHERRTFILLSCHSAGYEVAALTQLLRDAFNDGAITAGEMFLPAPGKRRLPSGFYARWIRKG